MTDGKSLVYLSLVICHWSFGAGESGSLGAPVSEGGNAGQGSVRPVTFRKLVCLEGIIVIIIFVVLPLTRN